MNNTYCVYAHINKTNGKRYVGITSQDPEIRWKNGHAYNHNPHLTAAFKKYGWDGFDHIILHDNLSQIDACNLEKDYIKKWNLTNNNYGYNVSLGGKGSSGVIPSQQTREKMSTAKIGTTLSDIHKKKIQNSSRKKCVGKFSQDGILLNIYPSIREAARQNQASSSGISACCRNKHKHIHGYIWKYMDYPYNIQINSEV